MKLTEKMSYLKGYIDGIDLDVSTKEGKILSNVVDVMQEMVAYIEDLQGQVDELTELCEILDEDLGNVEDDFYEDSDDDDDDDDYDDYSEYDDDEEFYEVVCPSCGNSITLDSEMLEEGSIMCPDCGEELEFDLDDLDQEDFDDIIDEKEMETDI